MEIAEVQDRESLQRYLEALPEGDRHEIARLVSSRAATRVLPFAALEFSLPLGDSEFGRGALTSLGVVLSVSLDIEPVRTSFRVSGGEITASSFGNRSSSIAFASAVFASFVPNDSESFKQDLDLLSTVTDAAVDAAAYAAEALKEESSTIWFQVRRDIVDKKVDELWMGMAPPAKVSAAWKHVKVQLQSDSNLDWSFWIAWYERILDGRNVLPDALVLVFNRLRNEDWEKGPAHINPMFDGVLAQYRAQDLARSAALQTDISKAAYFDFIAVNQQMRAVSFPSEQSAFPDDAARDAFLAAAKDLRFLLLDWVELAQAHLRGRNAPLTITVSIAHILDQLSDLENGKDVSLRNLVRLGSTAKRLARSDEVFADLGENLLELLNEALDDYSALMRVHLGDVLAALDALRSLELGDVDSAELLASMTQGYARLKEFDTTEILPPDQRTAAIFNDMIADLESEQSEIAEARTQTARDMRGKRFAEKFGGVSATLSNYVDKGTRGLKKGGAQFDELVKWSKRWENIEKIKDWWDALGGGS